MTKFSGKNLKSNLSQDGESGGHADSADANDRHFVVALRCAFLCHLLEKLILQAGHFGICRRQERSELMSKFVA